MEIRELLAAQAPQDIPDWFVHVEPPKPKRPSIPSHCCFIVREELGRWIDGKSGPNTDYWDRYLEPPMTQEQITALLESLEDKVTSYRRAYKAWERSNELARLGQWPWFWADNILANRDRITQFSKPLRRR
jgi:hypothetical protein